MNWNWTNTYTHNAQALSLCGGECLRDGARVPGSVGMQSVNLAAMTKDFIVHEPGGSDG